MTETSIALTALLVLAASWRALAASYRPGDSETPKVAQLRCEYLTDPMGIDVLQPRLSWIMDSDLLGQKQTAYQVLVASTPQLLENNQGDLWDSGKVESDQSINVEYAGSALTSRQMCYWKVRLWDMDGNPTDFSDTASWSMGLLNPADWKAQWIGLEPAIAEERFAVANLDSLQFIWGGPGEGAEAQTRFFRREFALPAGDIQSAAVAIFGEEDFTLWVNGKQAAHAEKSNRPIVADVAQYLVPGKNLLAVEVKNAKAKTNRCGLIARFGAKLREGNDIVSTEFSTDESWQTTDKQADNWNQPDFNASNWSAARTTGGLLVSDQNRQWIWHPADAPGRYMRKEFTASGPIRRATAFVSGLGWYELHINGQKVGDHVLDPVVSDYTKRAFYCTFDVTSLLKPGANAVGAMLGLGRFCDMRFRLQIEVEYADGSSGLWCTDNSWKATDDGPILSQSEYDGETYDATKELDGWDQPGFDDSSWRSAWTNFNTPAVMSAQMVEPIRVTARLLPQSITEIKPGVYIFDMGQNMVGFCRLRVHGPAGTIITLRHAETLKPDGNIYVDNLRTAKATDEYILKGTGEEIFQPHFTYHGFRFVELHGYPGTPTLDDLEGLVVNDDVAASSEFDCASPLLNQIHHNIEWGVRGNYNGVPTDCPQRNERLGWLGDRGEECAGEAYLFDIAALYQKWLGDMRDTQTEAGSVSDTAPGNLNHDGVVWPSTYMLAADMIYNQYDNTRALADHYAAMKKWVQYMNGFLENGIMPRNTYGDWCVPPESKELVHSKDPLRNTDGKLLSTAYFFHDLRIMSKAAGILGKTDDANQFDAEAESMKNAFNREFLNSQTGQYSNGSQTSSVLPLAFGMVPPDSKKLVFDFLINKIQEQSKDHLGTGLVGGQWLMRVLTDNGRGDLAYTIATQTTYPSWGYMAEKGATTIWELWNGDTADPSMNSGNHVMLVGDLNIWLHEYVLGIAPDPASPGWKHFLFYPRLTGRLEWARGSFNSPYGRIECNWLRTGQKLTLTARVPANSTATVFLPARSASQVTASPGATFRETRGGWALYDLPSGSFTLSSKLGG